MAERRFFVLLTRATVGEVVRLRSIGHQLRVRPKSHDFGYEASVARSRSETPLSVDAPALTAAPHCLDESQPNTPCLELIRVDLGGSADHVVRKCTHDIERRFTLAPFQQIFRTQQFRLVVITGTAPKAAAIRASVANQHWPEGLAVHLSVVFDLFPLLARLSHAA